MPNLVNISIDDVSPHPLSSTKVLKHCHNLISLFPNIKFSLFVPMAYWRTIKKETKTKYPLEIDEFKDFCQELNLLSDDNFELCFHGVYHGIPGKSDNDEFQSIDYRNTIYKIEKMKEIAIKAGLQSKFKNIFRPPAWRMSSEAIKAFRDKNFKILALSPAEYAVKTYNKEHLNKNDVVFYNCNPPFIPLKLYEKTEIVYHACEWDKNYLCSKKTDELKSFILKNQDTIKFSFIEELV
jgi:hypothetical protein